MPLAAGMDNTSIKDAQVPCCMASVNGQACSCGMAREDALLIALHAAINAPKGVVPKEAEAFYSPRLADLTALAAERGKSAPSDPGADDLEVKF